LISPLAGCGVESVEPSGGSHLDPAFDLYLVRVLSSGVVFQLFFDALAL
jgi:hypothetical protein